jgi:hypothetical protein
MLLSDRGVVVCFLVDKLLNYRNFVGTNLFLGIVGKWEISKNG